MTDAKQDIGDESGSDDIGNIKIELQGITTHKKVPKRKLDYAAKMRDILQEYNTCLVVGVTNVGSRQIADLRKQLRGKARFLFGKNTMIRKVIRDYVKETGNAKWMKLMEICKGNTGFCFMKGSVIEMRKILLADKKQCPAKAGIVAPVDVWVQPGPTGMEPTQTQFFQAMDIPTRINRGQIDITDPVQVVFKGQKVGASQASLLIKLGIKPFFYGMKVITVYEDGNVYDAKVCDITDNDIANEVFRGMRSVAAFSFALNYPSILTVPHTLLNAYKKVVALGLNLKEYSWDNLKTVREILANPDAFKAAAAAPTGGDGKPAEKKEAPKEETPEKESEAAPVGLFGGGGDDSSSAGDDDDDDSDSD